MSVIDNFHYLAVEQLDCRLERKLPRHAIAPALDRVPFEVYHGLYVKDRRPSKAECPVPDYRQETGPTYLPMICARSPLSTSSGSSTSRLVPN